MRIVLSDRKSREGLSRTAIDLIGRDPPTIMNGRWKSKTKWITLPWLVLVLLFGSPFLGASETAVFMSGKVSAPGGAYDYNKQTFIGQNCVTGDPVPRGLMESTIHVDTNMKQEDVSQSLGFGLSGRARFGIAEASLGASFFTEAASSSYSLSTIYSAIYNFQTLKLENVKLSALGSSVEDNFERWQSTCGGGYVDEVHKGARLFLSVRVDFKSDKQKQDFEENFHLSSVWAGADQTLKTASQKFSRDIKIVVAAYQLGGDPSKLSALFGNSDAAEKSYMECSLGQFESCAAFLTKALHYATNTDNGFPSQIAQHPADVSYGIATYDTAGIYKNPPPGLSLLVEQSRTELATLFDKSFSEYLTASRQEAVTPLHFKREQLKGVKDTLWANLVKINEASKICYDTPDQCPAAVHEDLQLNPIDVKLLQPPTWSEVCHAALALPQGSEFRATVEAILFVQQVDIVADDLAPDLYPYNCGPSFGEAATIRALDLSAETLAATRARFEASHLPHFKHLFSGSGPISDLTPLLALPTLTSVTVNDQQLTDLRPLSLLTELETVVLNNNKIDDIEALRNLHHLRHLELSDNQISDLSPLKDLLLLRELKISNNQIVHLDAVGGLTDLHSLIATNNHIDDLTLLNSLNELQILNVEHNAIKSLDQCPNRLLYLDVMDNFIPDPSFQRLCGHCGAPALIRWGAKPADPHIMGPSTCGSPPGDGQMPGPVE
jgi:Leucine Rich repeats (2 copies)